MLNLILEVGRNQHGMFYDVINPVDGKVSNGSLADTWGYNLNGFYTLYWIDGVDPYREATVTALSNLRYYRNYTWEGASADGYADSIESAMNLCNRERVDDVPSWLDSEIQVMWGKQKADGVIESGHGDGNFARKTIMYCLWKTLGISVQPWREDVVLGAVGKGGTLHLALKVERDWSGKLMFDTARYKTNMKMPLDWPRINQFPEWFTVKPDAKYANRDTSTNNAHFHTGEAMGEGIDVSLKAGVGRDIRIERH